MRTLLVLLLCITGSMIVKGQSGDREEITRMLAAQVTEWNKGNIAGYMKGYWEHDSLVFIGKSGPTYGYQQTLDRYKKSYPGRDAMGMLTSTVISMKPLGAKHYFVIGKWHLKRKAGDLGGSYTLLLEKVDGEWVIITDHSS